LERARREYDRFSRDLNRLSSLHSGATQHAAQDSSSPARETLTQLHRNKQLIGSRIDRLENSRRMLEQEIARGKKTSSSCPNCTQSDIRLFCRQSEAVLTRLRDAQTRVRSAIRTFGTHTDVGTLVTHLCDTVAALQQRPVQERHGELLSYAAGKCREARHALARDKTQHALRIVFHVQDTLSTVRVRTDAPCSSVTALLVRADSLQHAHGNEKTGKIIAAARTHLQKADRLTRTGNEKEAKKECIIARRFAQKAVSMLEKTAQ
jgi:hypothetical protein